MKNISIFIAALVISSCAHKHGHHIHEGDYKPKFTKMGEGRKIPFSPGHTNTVHVSVDDLPSHISVVEINLAPKSLGAPPHKHTNEDEVFVVLDGTVHFLNGKEEVIGKRGTVASLPRGHFHGFWNPTKKPAKMALIIAPGHFENFFNAIETAVKDRKPKSPQEFGAIVGELAGERGVHIDMSKLPPSGLKLLPPPPKK